MRARFRRLVLGACFVLTGLIPVSSGTIPPQEAVTVPPRIPIAETVSPGSGGESTASCIPQFAPERMITLGPGRRAALGSIDGGVGLAWVTDEPSPALVTGVLPADGDTVIRTSSLSIPPAVDGVWSLRFDRQRADVIGVYGDSRSPFQSWISSTAGAQDVRLVSEPDGQSRLTGLSVAELSDRCVVLFSLASETDSRLMYRTIDCWTGAPLEAVPIVVLDSPQPISAPSLAVLADRLVLTYLVDDASGPTVWTASLTPSGQIVEPPRKLSSGRVQTPPMTVGDETEVYAAWVENFESRPVVMFARVTSTGPTQTEPRSLAMVGAIPSSLRLELATGRLVVGLRTSRTDGDELTLIAIPRHETAAPSASISISVPDATLLDWAGTPDRLTLLLQRPDGVLVARSGACGSSAPSTPQSAPTPATASAPQTTASPAAEVVELVGPAPGAGVSLAVAPDDATYITTSANATLTAERVLTAGDGIQISDAGANSTMTVAVKDCAANELLRRNLTDTAWVCAPLVPEQVSGADAVTINPDSDADGTALLTIQDRAITVAPSTGPHRQFDVDGGDGDPAEFLFVTEPVQTSLNQGLFPAGSLGAGLRIVSHDQWDNNLGAFINLEMGLSTLVPGEAAQLLWVTEYADQPWAYPSFALRTRVDINNDSTFDNNVTDLNDFWDPSHIIVGLPTMLINPIHDPGNYGGFWEGMFALKLKGAGGGTTSHFKLGPNTQNCPAASYGENSWYMGGGGAGGVSSTICLGGIPDKNKFEVVRGNWTFDYNPEPAHDLYGSNAIYTPGSIRANEGLELGAFFGRNTPEGTIRGGQTDPNDDGTADQYITLHDPFGDPFDYTGYGRFEVRTWAGVDPVGSGWTRSSSFRIDGWTDIDGDNTIEQSEAGRVINEVGPLVQGAGGFDGSVEFTPDGTARMRVWSRLCGSSMQWVIDLDADGAAEATDLCLGDQGISADCDCSAEWRYSAAGASIDPDDDGTAEVQILTDGAFDWDMDGSGTRPYCGSVTVDPGAIASLTKGTATAAVSGLPADLTCECYPTLDWADTVAPSTGDDLLQQHCSTSAGNLNVRLFNAGGVQLDGDSRTVRYCCWSSD